MISARNPNREAGPSKLSSSGDKRIVGDSSRMVTLCKLLILNLAVAPKPEEENKNKAVEEGGSRVCYRAGQISTVGLRPSRSLAYRTGASRASVLVAVPKLDDEDPNTAE